MRRAPLTVAAIAMSLVLAPAAEAKPRKVLTDPKGDYPAAGADVVSATFDTVKKTKLVVTIEFAGAPSTPVPFAYQLRFTSDENCNWRGNYFGETFGSSGGCSTDDANPPTVTVKGNTLVYTMAAKGALKPGTELSLIAVSSSPGGALAGAPGGDAAATDMTYVVGS